MPSARGQCQIPFFLTLFPLYLSSFRVPSWSFHVQQDFLPKSWMSFQISLGKTNESNPRLDAICLWIGVSNASLQPCLSLLIEYPIRWDVYSIWRNGPSWCGEDKWGTHYANIKRSSSNLGQKRYAGNYICSHGLNSFDKEAILWDKRKPFIYPATLKNKRK